MPRKEQCDMIFPNSKKNRLTQTVAAILAALVIAGVLAQGSVSAAAVDTNPGTTVAAAAVSAKTGASGTKVIYTEANYPDLKNVGYGTYVKLNYQQAEGKNTYFYDFRKEWRSADANNQTGKYAMYMTNTIGFYGVTATAKDSTITYTVYSELDNVKVSGVEFHTYDDAKYNVLKSEPGKAHTLSVAKLPNGPYSLCVWFDYTKSDGKVETLCTWTPVYVSDGTAWFAKSVKFKDNAAVEKWLADNRNNLAADDAFQAWMKKNGGDDMKTALRTDNIVYPFYSGTERYPNNTSKWQALAHEICPDENTTDFRKAYLLHEWMSHNLVYDKQTVLDKKPYRHTAGAGYTTWETHIGECFDFANIYAIMCRELGIPCRTLGDDVANHCYNAIYLNGRWEIVDLVDSCDSVRIANNKDAVKEFWAGWDGPGVKAQNSMGFLVAAKSKYQIHSYEADKYDTIEERIADLDKLDRDLSTKELLKAFGGVYNH